MPEPRTHYQVSFTSRQAVLLFVVVLASLAGAYFLGLMTGLRGRPPADGIAAVAPTPSPAPAVQPTPALRGPAPAAAVAATESPTSAPALAAGEPGAPGGLQFFEDHPEEAAKTGPTPTAKKAAAAAGERQGFWVQILATSSEREARSRRSSLSARGYHAAVEAARGPKGPQYRVRVGPYSSREAAARAADVLARKERVKTWIVPPGE